MEASEKRAEAYRALSRDRVREDLERNSLAALLRRLIALAPGGRVLDLGCGDALVADILGPRLTSYVGVDLVAETDTRDPSRTVIRHDIADGLGPVGATPFDLYVTTFGVGSHVDPDSLRRLIEQIRRHARHGAVLAIDCLALHSLEWPGLWDSGPERFLPYELSGSTIVYPWSAAELAGAVAHAGLELLFVADQSVQFGPKLGDHGYWPAMPELRQGMNGLLDGQSWSTDAMLAPLPPLPAHPAAEVHHALATKRAATIRSALARSDREQLIARQIAALEPQVGGGHGHRVVACARVR